MDFQRSPNQLDLSWFIDMDAQQRLNLTPEYQRYSVWTYKDKQFFLDSVLQNYPCPAVYLHKEHTERGPVYNVVDGKQRLTTILDFHAGRIRLGKKFGIEKFRGLKFKDLPESVKASFYNYTFTVEQFRADGDVEWGGIFERVNKNQKKLTEQELRHARFGGWLISRAESEVLDQSFWRDLGVSSRTRASRMKDVEFVSLLMLVILERDYVGFPQDRIDDLYAKYELDLEELPYDEADLDLENDDGNPEGFTQETFKGFEQEYKTALNVLIMMEDYNRCLTNHKRRLFTDLYSLWCTLIMSDEVKEIEASDLAQYYDTFLNRVDEAFTHVKEGKALEGFPEEVIQYQAYSTGAATEVEPRRKRHEAFLKYVRAAHNQD